MEVVGDMINQVVHLSDAGAAITLCGTVIGIGWGVRKMFYWIGQIGCKDCRAELSRRKQNEQMDSRNWNDQD